MEEGFYYKDPDYGDWIVLGPGKNPMRESYPTEEAIWGAPDRINPPPDSNPAWYIGDGQQWRKEPVRILKWDREGIHGILGLIVGALFPLAAIVPEIPHWYSVGTVALVTFLFLTYEITEGLRIRDWAYRDIGFFVVGLLVSTFIGVIPTWLFAP